MSNTYPYASAAKVSETLAVLETGNIAFGDVALKQILVALCATGTPQPPSVKPFLFADAEVGSYFVNLTWTASNRSPQYKVYVSDDGVTFNEVTTTSSLAYTYEAPETPDALYFYVTPFNLAGEGPSSDTVSQVVPGEPEAGSLYLRPDLVSLYLRPDGVSLYIRP